MATVATVATVADRGRRFLATVRKQGMNPGGTVAAGFYPYRAATVVGAAAVTHHWHPRGALSGEPSPSVSATVSATVTGS